MSDSFMNVRYFFVCMMASRAGDRTAGDFRQRFLRRAAVATPRESLGTAALERPKGLLT